MANQQWVSLLNPGQTNTGPGTLFTASATTAVISPQTSASSNADYAVVNAGYQPLGWYPGLLVRVTARGFTTTNATTGTRTFSLRANKSNSTAVASNVVLATAVGITTGAVTITGAQWSLAALIRCTAIAASGNTASTEGEIHLSIVGAATPIVPANPFGLVQANAFGFTIPLPNISGETAAAVDTTVVQGIQLAVTDTAASGSTQCTQWLVEALN